MSDTYREREAALAYAMYLADYDNGPKGRGSGPYSAADFAELVVGEYKRYAEVALAFCGKELVQARTERDQAQRQAEQPCPSCSIAWEHGS